MVILLENLIELLPETTLRKIAENININETDQRIIKKRLLNAFSSEAFLIKNVGESIDVYRNLMSLLFKGEGLGEIEEPLFEDEVKEFLRRGLIFIVKDKADGKNKYLIPFEYYFVSEFFHPSYFSLLFALQHYEDDIINLIADHYGIQTRGYSKIVIARKIYHLVTRNIEKIKADFTKEERELLEEMYYSRDKEYWKNLFITYVDKKSKNDKKVYIKELFFNTSKKSPLFSLLIKTILIPVADRTKLFVEELAVPVEFDNEIFKDLREKEKKIICELRDIYLREEKIGMDEYYREFTNDVKRLILYLIGRKIKATTTRKVYFKDKKRICDYFIWEDQYFDIMWDFISHEKLLDINPYTRALRLNNDAYDIFTEKKESIFRRVYEFFKKYGKCSDEIKSEIMKELLSAYPSYIDVHYFVEVSKKISSDLSRVAIKEEMPPEELFRNLYKNLFFMGLAVSSDECIFNLKLHENTVKLLKNEPLEFEKEEIKKPWFNEDTSTFIFPIAIKRDVLNFILKTGEIAEIGEEHFKVRFKREKFEEFIKDEDSAEFVSDILKETFSEEGEKLLSEFYDKSIFEQS